MNKNIVFLKKKENQVSQKTVMNNGEQENKMHGKKIRNEKNIYTQQVDGVKERTFEDA